MLNLKTPIYTVGGTVQPDSGVYIPRQADEDLLSACRAGDYAYVLTARQLGKSSLMVRTARRLEEEGVRSVIIDLNELGVQTTVQEWYLGLMFRITSRLRLKVNLLQWWREHEDVGVTQRLSLFFQEIVLRDISERVVIFIDEIDTTLSLEFTDDFFAAIRYLYNARSTEPTLQRLSFVLIGVATPSDLIDDAKRTPFNIGRRIDLSDFTRAEAAPLGAGLPGEGAQQVKLLDQVIAWTNGHPYLTQRLCAELANQANGRSPSVNATVDNIFLGENATKDNNLQFVRDMLTRRAPDGQTREVLTTYQQIRLGRSRVRDEANSRVKSHLKLSGVVKRTGDLLTVRNKIYAKVFDRRWIRGQWPVSWWELIPFEVKVAAGVIVLLLIGLLLTTLFALRQQRVAETAVQELGVEVALRATAEGDALTQANLAESNAQLAATREQEAIANFDLAATREAEALDNAALAAQRAAEASQNAALAEAQARVAQSRALASSARLAQAENGQLGLLLALQSLRTTDTVESRQSLQAASANPNRAERRHTLAVGNWTSPFAPGEFSPNGRSLLVVNGQEFVVTLWDVASGSPQQTLRHDSYITSASWHPAGERILTSASDGVRIWDAPSGELLTFFEVGPASHAAWSANGSRAASVDFAEQSVRLFDVATGNQLLNMPIPEMPLRVAFSPAGLERLLVTGEQRAFVFDLNGRLLFELDPPGINTPNFLWNAAWNATGDRILTHNALLEDADALGSALIWDGLSGAQLHNLDYQSTQAFSTLVSGVSGYSHAAWNADGTQVITSGVNNLVIVWDAAIGSVISEQNGLQEGTLHVNGDLMLSEVLFSSVDASGTPRDQGGFTLRHLPSGEQLNFVETDHQVHGMAWSADRRWAVTFTLDGSATVWEFPPQDPLTYLTAPTSVESAIWSNAENRFYVETVTGEVLIVDGQDGRVLTTLEAVSGLGLVDWSNDDSQIMLARRDGTLAIHNALSGKLVQSFSHPLPLLFAEWRSDDAQILTTDQSGTLRLWDVASGDLLFTREDANAFLVLWNAQETALLAGGFDNRVRLFSAADGSLLTEIETSATALFTFFGLEAQDHAVTLSSQGYDLPFVFDPDEPAPNPMDGIDLTSIRLFELPTELAVWRLDAPETPLWSVTYPGVVSALPNKADTQLMVYTWPQAVELGVPPLVDVRDVATGELLFSGEHPGGIVSAQWLGDNGRFLTLGADGQLRVWSLDAAEPERILGLVDQPIADFDATDDGEKVLLGGSSGLVLREFILAESLIETLCSHAYRNLLWSEWQRFLPGQPYALTCPQLPAHTTFIERVEQPAGAVEVAAFFSHTQQSPELYAATTWNEICWWGSLHGQAEQLGPACDHAVEFATTELDIANHRDSRALQRALSGDFEGAVLDLRAFLQGIEPLRDELAAEYAAATPKERQTPALQSVAASLSQLESWIEQRTAWVAQLEAGENPYDEATLAGLLAESQE